MGHPNTTKVRYVSGGQQIMRLDIERPFQLSTRRRQSNGIRRRVARHARSQATPYPARARHSVNAIERLCL